MSNSPYHIFQASDSYTCGPCCLAMVYAMKGKDIKLQDILKDFHQPKRGKPTYTAQLVSHLHKNGIKTKLITSTSKVLSYAWADLPREKLIENIKEWLTFHKKTLWCKEVKNILSYLEEGGELEQKSYTSQTIKDILDRHSLVILCIDEDWAWGHRLAMVDGKRIVDDIKGKLEGHFVLVTGYKDNMFHVLDPFPTNIENRHGEYDIDVDQLTNASLTWDPEIIEILQ